MSMRSEFEEANLQDKFLRSIEERFQPTTPMPIMPAPLDIVEDRYEHGTLQLRSDRQHKHDQTVEKTGMNHWKAPSGSSAADDSQRTRLT